VFCIYHTVQFLIWSEISGVRITTFDCQVQTSEEATINEATGLLIKMAMMKGYRADMLNSISTDRC